MVCKCFDVIVTTKSGLVLCKTLTLTFVLVVNRKDRENLHTRSSGLKKNHMSLVVRKPVFGVSDEVRHKRGCTATEDG